MRKRFILKNYRILKGRSFLMSVDRLRKITLNYRRIEDSSKIIVKNDASEKFIFTKFGQKN